MADFRSVVAAINEKLDGLDRHLETIEQRKPLSATIEVVELEKTVPQLKNEDQEALSSDLDIGHLPEMKGENILHTVIQVAAKLGVTLEERDIVFVERVGSADRVGKEKRARRVVVRLARRQLRYDLLSAARVRRTLSSTQLDIVAPTQRIYLNERLTRANRQLFHQVREECRRLQWRFSWTKRVRIYARQGDGKQVYPIRSEADVKRVFGPNLV
ncbi:Zinc finger DNA binding protein [Operophtera brumata]|uniref:Zinc finger DNA binding protein n=1 Tax=Operophtera brumata TaxID=104452 RepID=A0A0L7LF78_OPEBR|nr:Zinc finger DNA binding protein [Operophtera brumata]